MAQGCVNSNVEGHPLRQQTWEYYKLHGLCCLERSRRWKPSSTSLIRQRSMKLFSAQLGKPPSWARPSCFVPFAEENAGNFANHITSCLQKGFETMDGNTIFVCLSFCWEEQLFLFSFAPPCTVHSFRILMCIIHLAAREKVSVLCLPGRTKYSALLKSLCNNRAKTHRLASEEARAHKLPWATCSHKHKENGPSKQQSLVEPKGFSHVYVLLGQPFLSSPLSSSLDPLCPHHFTLPRLHQLHRFCRLGLHKLQSVVSLVVLSWFVMKGCPGCGTAK